MWVLFVFLERGLPGAKGGTGQAFWTSQGPSWGFSPGQEAEGALGPGPQ